MLRISSSSRLTHLIAFCKLQRCQSSLLSRVPVTSTTRGFSTIPAQLKEASLTSNSPSSTTTVLLRHLPDSITEDVLVDQFKDLHIRKSELEPGFVCHTSTEIDALFIEKMCRGKHNLTTSIVNTSFPSLVLNNLSPDASIESIQSTFQKFGPLRIQLIGTLSLEVRPILQINC